MWVLWGVVRRLLVRVLFALGLRRLLAHLLGARERGAPSTWASGGSGRPTDGPPPPKEGAVVIDVQALGLFAHYTDAARQLAARAVDLAHELDHPLAGTPHLLLALTEADGSPAAILSEHGIDTAELRTRITAPQRDGPDGPVTEGLARTLRSARQQAARRGGVDVLPRDLLAAVVSVADDDTRRVLQADDDDALQRLRHTFA